MTASAAAPTVSASPQGPSLRDILRDAIRGAPLAVRRSAAVGVVAWVVVMVGQAFDSASRPGVAAIAEFLSALSASAGGVMLGLSGLLQSAAEHRDVALDDPARAAGLRRVLIALPALALASAALLAGAIALMIVRALLGTPVVFAFVMTVMFSVMLWLAAATAMRATRTLYAHASMEADRAAAARVQAGEARLAALQARMNPHFLFNALNTVASLVRTDARAAERVTEQLAGVLRRTLERSAHGTSSIGEEIDYVREWLAVEQARLGDRLRVEWDVDPSLDLVAIPPLVLQPLVENALHHGIGSRLEGGTIRIAVRRDRQAVVLSIADDGEGFAPVVAERTGLGNLRQRLATLYGTRASLEIDRSRPGGDVRVKVPL